MHVHHDILIFCFRETKIVFALEGPPLEPEIDERTPQAATHGSITTSKERPDIPRIKGGVTRLVFRPQSS